MHKIPYTGLHHDGGDDGLALSFVRAVAKAKSGEMSPLEAQREFLKCTVEELPRSHLAVFWMDESRLSGTVLSWQELWKRKVETKLKRAGLTMSSSSMETTHACKRARQVAYSELGQTRVLPRAAGLLGLYCR